MKRSLIIILFVFSTIMANSQTVFNRIIEDTVSHITNSVVATDTGYIVLTGTNNEELIRCFAFTYIDINGNKVWRKTYSDSQHQYWEGWDGNLKKFNNEYYFAGAIINVNSGDIGTNINIFSNTFDIISQNTIFYNSQEKKVFYSLRSSDSAYYLTGQIYDTLEDKFGLLLLKADCNSNYLWHKTLGNNAYEYGNCIIEKSDSTILTAGASWVTHSSNTRWYLVNTDTAGNIIWERYYGRENYNNGYVKALLETQDSNILACGSYPAAKYGSGGEEIIWDGCLRKIDQNGEFLWKKLYRNYSCHPTGTDITLSGSISTINEMDNGDIVMCGSSQWYYTILRGFLTKTDSKGNIKWHKYYYADDYTSTWQYFSSFQPTSDNGFIIAGYGNDYSNIGYDPPQQAWLVKTDSLGMDGLCNIEPDELNINIDITQTPESICMNDTIQFYVYISGKSAPYTIEFSTGQVIDSIYYPPCFVPVEIGLTDINLEWGGETYFEETITEATLSNHEWGQCIAKTIDFYTPTTWGSQDLYITVTDAYGESKTITKEIFAVECSTNNDMSEYTDFKIYPNPVQDKLNIEILENIGCDYIEIYDCKGQLVIKQNVEGMHNSISTDNLISGTYVLKLIDKYGNIKSKVFEKIE